MEVDVSAMSDVVGAHPVILTRAPSPPPPSSPCPGEPQQQQNHTAVHTQVPRHYQALFIESSHSQQQQQQHETDDVTMMTSYALRKRKARRGKRRKKRRQDECDAGSGSGRSEVVDVDVSRADVDVDVSQADVAHPTSGVVSRLTNTSTPQLEENANEPASIGGDTRACSKDSSMADVSIGGASDAVSCGQGSRTAGRRLTRSQRRRRRHRRPAAPPPILRPLHVPLAPFNSTSFIMDDHEHCDQYTAFDSSTAAPSISTAAPSIDDLAEADEQADYMYSLRDFDAVYRAAHVQELGSLQTAQLRRQLQLLDWRRRQLQAELLRRDPDVWLRQLLCRLRRLQQHNALLVKTRRALSQAAAAGSQQ